MEFNHLYKICSKQHRNYSLMENEVLHFSQADRALPIPGNFVLSPIMAPTYLLPRRRLDIFHIKIQEALFLQLGCPTGLFGDTIPHERGERCLDVFCKIKEVIFPLCSPWSTAKV